ncbi:MAG TPA: HemK family protein methyltransferase [Burkholderiales bacterium]|nr:HemK family protein methyltransferase [Burkholderiales bacterium]
MPIEEPGTPQEERTSVEAAIRAGRATFMGLELRVGAGALVPRAETELLARAALAELAGGSCARVIDMCCGTGNLACAIAHRAAGARVWASDLTGPCVDLARANAAALGLEDRVSVHQGDLFASLDSLGLEGTVDVVVCNPPYISEKRLLEERGDLLLLEPREAFAAGAYGLSIHQRVIREALRYLRPGGILLVEIGAGQQKQVEMLYARAREYEDVRAIRDAAGEPRVIGGRRRAPPAQPHGESI